MDAVNEIGEEKLRDSPEHVFTNAEVMKSSKAQFEIFILVSL